MSPTLHTVPKPNTAEVNVEDLISKPAAGRMIGVSSKTVDRLIAAGKLPAYNIAGTRTVRVRVGDVLALVERVA